MAKNEQDVQQQQNSRDRQRDQQRPMPPPPKPVMGRFARLVSAIFNAGVVMAIVSGNYYLLMVLAKVPVTFVAAIDFVMISMLLYSYNGDLINRR